jgi:hypothetical protein
MNPLTNLLMEVAKVLVTLHPHLQPHIDAAQDEFDYHSRPKHVGGDADKAAPADFEKVAEKVGAGVVEDVIEDEVSKIADSGGSIDPNAKAEAPAKQADEYTGDGKAAE